MENYKIRVDNEAESKEIQELFFELGYGWCCGDIKKTRNTSASYIYCYKISKDMSFGNRDDSFYNHKNKEITIQYLRDLVVLKRNDVLDATHYDSNNYYWYVANDEKHYRMQGCTWVYQPYIEGLDLKLIKKEVKMKEREYLDTNYELRSVKQTSGDNLVPTGWLEVPEGAEILYFDKRYEPSNHFFKTVNGKSYYKYLKTGSKWMEYNNKGLNVFKENIDNFRIMWQRNTTTTNTSTQEKLKFIEKWLNGEKIQYILGIESEKTQVDESKWHNFTEGAMQYIKRPDIKFREAPKYVTINGIEFKSVEELLKYVKNNFDLEDGE